MELFVNSELTAPASDPGPRAPLPLKDRSKGGGVVRGGRLRVVRSGR